MSRISAEESAGLRRAIHEHDHWRQIVRRVEQLQRIVFHDEEHDGRWVRLAAEEIVIADIVVRHHGDLDGVREAVRRKQASGNTLAQALLDYAGYIHNYYTMPLGARLRMDLFGRPARDAIAAMAPAAYSAGP